GLRVLRLGGVEGAPAPLEARAGRRPRELRRHPPGRHLRLADAADRLALGEDLLGPLVAVEREPARALPRALPLLRRLLHASLLGRARPRAREHVRRVRALRGRPDPHQLPRDQAGESAHPSGRVHAAGPANGRLDVPDVLRLARGNAESGGDPLPHRAGREAARFSLARAAGAGGLILAVTAAEKYVAAAYGLVFLVVLVYVLIIGLKLGRLERELDELTGQVRERREAGADAERREEVPVG